MFDSLLSLLFGSYSHKFISMRLSKLYRYGLLYDSTRRSGTEGGETAGCGLWPVPRLPYRCYWTCFVLQATWPIIDFEFHL